MKASHQGADHVLQSTPTGNPSSVIHPRDELCTYYVSISELWASQTVAGHRAHALGDSTYIFQGTYCGLEGQ